MAANLKRFAKDDVKTPLTEKTLVSNLISKQKASTSVDASNCCDGLKLLLPVQCVPVCVCGGGVPRREQNGD